MNPNKIFLLLLFPILFTNGQKPARYVDSLKEVISQLPDDTNKIITLNLLAFEVKYGNEELCRTSLKTAIELGEKLKYHRGLGDSYKTQGILFDEHGQYNSAVHCYMQALSNAHKSNDQMGIARTEANIGIVLRKLNKDREAIGYFQRSLQFLRGKKPYFEMLINMNIGICFMNLNQTDSALYYQLASYKIMTENNIEDGNVFGNLGLVYAQTKEYEKAEQMIKKCLDIKHAQNDNPGSIATWNHNLAEVYRLTNRKEEGLALLLEAARLLGNDRFHYEGMHTYKGLLKYYEDKLDARNIIKYSHLLSGIKDSIYNTQSSQQINELKEKYETDKKESEIKLLTADKALSDQQLKTDRIIFVAGGISLILLILFIGFAVRSNKQKQRINKELIVKNVQVENQKTLVEEKQREILDSIGYAKRLQNAILPPPLTLTKKIPESFIYYLPKDIVAGDFYWMEIVKENNKEILLIAAADCTGHGVPGAMVSMVCSNALHRAVSELKIIEPAKILDKVREFVQEAFDKGESDVKDGMDISLAAIETDTGKVSWSGANNPLWFVKGNVFNEIKANKQAIGKTDDPVPFVQHHLQLSKGDSIYLFTDGFADQFGGPKGKKYKYQQLKERILSLRSKSAENQKTLLHSEFLEWKGSLEQVDDICIIGITL